jgi:glycine dehydrogenase subunit 2
MKRLEPLIFEVSSPGRKAYSLPELGVPDKPVESMLPKSEFRTTAPELPEVAEVDLIRHFTRLSQLNHGVDIGFYPLGSCTMKYSPKINEEVSNLPGLAEIHPYAPEETVQGALQLMYEMQQYMCEIGGMEKFTLQPAAGAHGELTGINIIRAYHQSRHDDKRTKILIPDAAHGTNPASSVLAGFQTVTIPSDVRGGVDTEALANIMDETVAGLMLTNPNTLGLFDENIEKIEKIVHGKGGLLYYDGANANAIMGICRPGDMGFDVMHFNLHKTFSTPHGGGGPGSVPVGVKKHLIPFLPVPTVEFDGKKYWLDYNRPQSIGQMKSFYGNFLVIVKAYAYIRSLGPDGLKAASEDAVLNANYILRRITEFYDLPYDRHYKHEFVVSPQRIKTETGCHTMDISKRLLDYGVHPPTNYFPLIVDEAIMIEPTETESKDTLDFFADALIEIAKEAYKDPQSLHDAPKTTVVGRLDEVGAAKNPRLRWRKDAQ